ARVLGGAAHEGHLILSFARPAEQQLAVELGVAGRVAPVRSDALAVTTSNSGANKIDYYLQRNVNYRVQLDPAAGGRRAFASGRLTLQLDNEAPDQGLPQIVIGPYIPGLYQAGENRAYLSVYSSLALQAGTLDGGPLSVTPGRERGRNVYSFVTNIPARSTQMLSADFSGTVRLERGGWYDLDVGRQPTVRPDRPRGSVAVQPRGRGASAGSAPAECRSRGRRWGRAGSGSASTPPPPRRWISGTACKTAELPGQVCSTTSGRCARLSQSRGRPDASAPMSER